MSPRGLRAVQLDAILAVPDHILESRRRSPMTMSLPHDPADIAATALGSPLDRFRRSVNTPHAISRFNLAAISQRNLRRGGTQRSGRLRRVRLTDGRLNP
jgi:hypothetical protein